jgi:hypothetical protein
MVVDQFGFEALGMLLEAFHEFRALNPQRVRRPVVHVGRGHQLTALGNTGDQHGFEVGTGGIYGRGVAGRAGSEYQEAAVAGGHLGFRGVRGILTKECKTIIKDRVQSDLP